MTFNNAVFIIIIAAKSVTIILGVGYSRMNKQNKGVRSNVARKSSGKWRASVCVCVCVCVCVS